MALVSFLLRLLFLYLLFSFLFKAFYLLLGYFLRRKRQGQDLKDNIKENNFSDKKIVDAEFEDI